MAHETYLGREVCFTLAVGQNDATARNVPALIVKVVNVDTKVMDIVFSCPECPFKNTTAYGIAYTASPEIGKWSWPS